MDIVAAAEIIPVLDTVTEPAAPSVIVSLLDVDFFDCSGLRLLCRARRRAEERGGRLVLVCTHPLTLRILQIVHLIAVFPDYETLDEALDRREASAC
ncbi:anti-sigma factor antagonist [Streptomyces sp. NPDC020192]|uniref:anti-sigma factor antagonist n=1 Tax=Streptomyces sp. NPDC020192 TaxID=3365066 RepID=UPI0037AFC858